MKNSFLILFALLSFQGFCQQPTPAPANADEECQKYIDELIEICDYESAFYFFREKIIKDFEEQEGWSVNKTKAAESKIIYNYSKGKFYNAFSIHTKEELIVLISKYKELTPKELEKEYPKYNFMIIHNFKNSIQRQCQQIKESEE